MSITDELRHEVAGYPFRDNRDFALFEAIADRIDAEHQKALDEWKAKHGQMWLKGYAECHAELLEGNETLASDLESCGWVRLPKDADGEYIRIGDVMRLGGVKRDLTVLGIGVNSEHDHDIGVFVLESDDYVWYNARFLRHYHAPTVEDVLREFANEVYADADNVIRDRDFLCAKYAKRLKLAGEEE